MSKFPWRNGFAVGITSGVCLATVIILFSQSIYDLARCNQNAQCYRHAAQYEGEDFPSSWWWRWTGDLVSSSDTLAQWIMAIFTIAVVLLVWRTLLATQEIARDTRDIGQKQARAYLFVKLGQVEVDVVANKDGSNLVVKVATAIANSGNSPAYAPVVHYDFQEAIPNQITPLSDPENMQKSPVILGVIEDPRFGGLTSSFRAIQVRA